MSRTDQSRALARLHGRIRQCDRCPLHRTRTQAVPGVGPASARVMLVGEAPGRQEDRQGEPFVGPAGHVLDDLLAQVGLSRDHVYITNVVKSRPFVGPPPGANRAPTPQEIAACRPWLDDQLTIIRPSVVVTLGRAALEYFFPQAKISKVHGKVLQQGAYTIIPLYHPAVALRRRNLLQVMKRDMRDVTDRLHPRVRGRNR